MSDLLCGASTNELVRDAFVGFAQMRDSARKARNPITMPVLVIRWLRGAGATDVDTEAYRRLSPFEQIPAIDDDGMVLSESAAIVVYLAKKCGRLMPAAGAGEAQALRWCFAAMNTVEPPLLGTVADILMAHVLTSGIKDERLISPYPALVAYRSRCLARPAWQRTIEAYGARVKAG